MLALGVTYLDAVAAAGGIPVILAPLPARRLEAIIERLDGICLSGGPDIEPATYGSDAHPELGPTEPGGGTLVQHLPDLSEQIAHRQPEPASQPSHGVTIAAETRLARIVESGRIDVNSFHHQAIDRLGAGLEPIAWSDDGVIEAVEAPGDAFTIGVQWHAECLTERPEQAALFASLVDAAEHHAGLAEEKAA